MILFVICFIVGLLLAMMGPDDYRFNLKDEDRDQ